MWGYRICYLTALAGCGLFYLAYGEWLSWLVLVLMLMIPWLSLLVSLPAILTFSMEPEGPDFLTQGEPGEIWLLGSSHYPAPPFQGQLRLYQSFTGQSSLYSDARGLPTEHCGRISVTIQRAKVCDYLGLFAFPPRKRGQKTILVRPVPVPLDPAPDLRRCKPRAWRPKPGGGFGENHELRLYRPGDSLNQVHWKLTAKTGHLMIREPLLPQRGLVLLTMNLSGDPEALDRKMGRLLWLGRCLTEQDIPFQLRLHTAQGLQSIPVASREDLDRAVDQLLSETPAVEGSVRDRVYAAFWQYHIGGEPDEV